MPLPGTRRTMTGDPLAHLIVACRGRSDECDRPPAACSQLFREAAFSAASASDDEYQPWDSCFLCRYYGLLLSMNQGPIMNFNDQHRYCHAERSEASVRPSR